MIIMPLKTGAIAGHHLSDGRLVWMAEVAAEKPVATDAERVYVAAGEAIHALNATTGAVLWRVGAGGPVTAAPLAVSGWVIVAAAGELLAIRATDGHIIWRRPIGPVDFRPGLDGDLLVVPVAEGHVLGLDVQTGTDLWRRELASPPTEPLAIGGRVYVGTRDKRFYALYASSGRVESSRFVGAVLLGRAAADDDHVYFAALDNVLWAVDRGHGGVEWKKGLTYRPAAGPVLLGGYVAVPGPVESIPAFIAKSGAPAGTIAFPARLVALPLFGESAGGSVFAIGITGNLENKWSLALFEPSPLPPPPLLPLTELPGEVAPLPTVPGVPKG
jgi:outer membrane protein assembly factor BamB